MFRQSALAFLIGGMIALLSACSTLDRMAGTSNGHNSQATVPADGKKRVAPKPRTASRKPVAAKTLATEKPEQVDSNKENADGEENDSRADEDVKNLVGLDQARVSGILGPPMAVSEKAPGKVWHYWNSECKLDVSLYLDVNARSYRVLAYEVSNHDNSPWRGGACTRSPSQFDAAGTDIGGP